MAAVDKLLASPTIGCVAYNIGTGKGSSVLELVKAYSAACGKVSCWHESRWQVALDG